MILANKNLAKHEIETRHKDFMIGDKLHINAKYIVHRAPPQRLYYSKSNSVEFYAEFDLLQTSNDTNAYNKSFSRRISFINQICTTS